VYALCKRAYEFPPNVISIIKEIDVESLLVWTSFRPTGYD
jgi:hypothetical protein